MTNQTPDQIAQRWAQNLGAASAKISAGVDAVKIAPGQAAARQKAVYAQNVAASVDKWAARTAAVSLPTWQDAMKNKGVARIGAGAQAAEPKFAGFLTQVLPHIAKGVAGLAPRGNLEANIARSAAFARHMSTFKRS